MKTSTHTKSGGEATHGCITNAFWALWSWAIRSPRLGRRVDTIATAGLIIQGTDTIGRISVGDFMSITPGDIGKFARPGRFTTNSTDPYYYAAGPPVYDYARGPACRLREPGARTSGLELEV